ncbi:hypothetical protein BGX28_007132 [Mortierella sp. GBA30]|nr:hypothetical protein BGX28_007132 [Mortierella sp. GBA30]
MPTTDSLFITHKVAVADIRRKHRSENGGSLVLDILIVLRENTELELPKFNRDAGDISPTPDSAEMRTATIPPLMVNEEKICSESTEGPSAMNVDIEVAEPDAGSETGHISPTSVLTVTSVQESTETQNTDAPLQDTGDETMEASASGNAPSLQLVEADAELSPRPPSPTSSRKSTGSASDQEKRDSFKEGKGAFFFHKMGVRKNSFTESSSSSSAASDSQEPTETSNLRPLMSHFSASVPLSTHLSHLSQSGKLTKRASKKLLGKLVPKFLHTSATNSTSETCPLSSRPSRSKSVSGHGPTRAMYSSAVASSSSISSSKESQESLLLDATPETEEEYSDVGSRPPSSMARRSSCCSESSKHSGNSLTSKPLGSFSSVSTTDATEAGSNEKYAIEGQYRQENSDATETGYSEEIIIGNSVEKDEISDHAGVAFDDDPPLSPYIIDENCDDAFFLNSVLRKRSIPTLNMDQQAVMTGSHPSNTTLSSMRSFATTPSMSGGWSSASCSQASTPSPTSPSFMNGQIYPFPSTATDSDTNLNYRTNPLPPPIKTGLDEKRNRLRDAVGEWRRSANASYYVV